MIVVIVVVIVIIVDIVVVVTTISKMTTMTIITMTRIRVNNDSDNAIHENDDMVDNAQVSILIRTRMTTIKN